MSTQRYDRALAERARRLHPAIAPDACEGGLGISRASDAQLSERLLTALRRNHPRAGSRYWAARLCLLATWQPIYLCVAGAEENLLLDLSSLRQAVNGASVRGYTFTQPPRPGNGDRSAVIAHNGSELRRFVDHTFGILHGLIRLGNANSYGLIADTLQNALVSAFEPKLFPRLADLVGESRQWSEACGLVNRCGEPLSRIITDGSQLQVSRCSCCRHYLSDVAFNRYCGNCPLLKTIPKIARYSTSS